MAREVQNRVLDLVDEAFGVPTKREQCPDWLRRPGRSECRDLWDTACNVYRELTGLDLPDVMPSRERRSLDAVIEHRDGTRRVIEVDEAQHFNRHRALTLEHYPKGTRLAFDRALWRERSLACTKLRGGGWGRAKPLSSRMRADATFSARSATCWPIFCHPLGDGPQRCASLTSRWKPGSTRPARSIGCVHSFRKRSMGRASRRSGSRTLLRRPCRRALPAVRGTDAAFMSCRRSPCTRINGSPARAD